MDRFHINPYALQEDEWVDALIGNWYMADKEYKAMKKAQKTTNK